MFTVSINPPSLRCGRAGKSTLYKLKFKNKKGSTIKQLTNYAIKPLRKHNLQVRKTTRRDSRGSG